MPHTLSTEMLTAWLRLSMTSGLGPISAQRLLGHFSCPLAIERCSPQQLAARVPKAIYEGLLVARGEAITRQIHQALDWALEPGQFILTPDQSAYPAQLQHTADAPLVLYATGDLARLHQPALAIVGARNATADGLEHARDFACTLARWGWCVVSGLAQGVDAAAHRGALHAGLTGGGTLAVLGTGADVVYPRQHAELVRRILNARGLLLTEFPLGTPARPHHFPRRNRIVAGLSHGVLVVEAALKSGSLLTAKLAVEMNREVFAIPGSIVSPLSRGPHALIQEGAKLVERPEDILDELRAFSPPAFALTEHARHATHTGALTADATFKTEPCSPVWDAIGYDPVSEDTIQQRTNMLPAILQCELLSLELNGDIERQPNGRIVRARRRS
jgi:DNA processing protein